jgi:selenocysteine lyase/cysteine desulfurase
MEVYHKSFSTQLTIDNIPDYIVGLNKKVPLLDGSEHKYINFDNAASTPALVPVMNKVQEITEWYSSIHRGTGFKSQLCSELFDYSREVVADFVNADLDNHSIIFGKNATEAINKLANRLSYQRNEVVLVSKMEHHSNDLPWRNKTKVIYVDVLEDGRLDVQDLIQKLKEFQGKIALVALTGASNVTGWVNDINRLAEICHEYGTKILIDAAQLAPHRAIDMKRHDDPRHIDFLALSAHKIYAPFGAGVLIGDKDFFEKGDPDYVGGGTVSIVSLEYAHWAESPEKDEAGTPNTLGVIALATSLLTIKQIEMENIKEHEKNLTHYMLERMKTIANVEIYGSSNPEVVDNRLGVISFNIKDMPHALTASILNYEGGIGVRNGCFCAHPYIKILLGMSEEEAKEIEVQIINGDRSKLPGAVRASFGMYNTIEEIDIFIEKLKDTAEKKYRGHYILDKKRGEYHPKGFNHRFADYCRLS